MIILFTFFLLALAGLLVWTFPVIWDYLKEHKKIEIEEKKLELEKLAQEEKTFNVWLEAERTRLEQDRLAELEKRYEVDKLKHRIERGNINV